MNLEIRSLALRDSRASISQGEVMQLGGLGVWLKERGGLGVDLWNSQDTNTPSWMDAERQWLKITGEGFQLAVCGVYLRTNKPLAHEYYKNNEELYTVMEMEAMLLSEEGYPAVIMGDFNAHVNPGERFQFQATPHTENNNGRSLVNFANNLDLHCLNPLEWDNVREDKITFQKQIGNNYLTSIIDYGMASKTTIPLISNFNIDSDGRFSISSDHATLVLTLNLEDREIIYQDKEVYKVQNWSKFKDSVKRKAQHKLVNLQTMSVNEIAETFTQVIISSASQCSMKVGENKKQKEPIKLVKVRRQCTKLAKLVKNSYRKGNMKKFTSYQKLLKDCETKLRKEQQRTTFRRLSKLRSKIKEGGKEGSKIFWQSINKKRKSSKFISVLENKKQKIVDPEGKAKVIVKHFKDKFKTRSRKEN